MSVSPTQRVDEVVYSTDKKVEGFVVMISQAFGFDQLPDALDQIEVWRVGGKVKHFNANIFCEFSDFAVTLVLTVAKVMGYGIDRDEFYPSSKINLKKKSSNRP